LIINFIYYLVFKNHFSSVIFDYGYTSYGCAFESFNLSEGQNNASARPEN